MLPENTVANPRAQRSDSSRDVHAPKALTLIHVVTHAP
jgi:hypothetical protein